MATFSNQATLSYNNLTTNSNIVTGEILEVLSVTKSALDNIYTADDTMTYIISIVNSGNTGFNGASLSDNLGSYAFSPTTNLNPLTYVDGSARYYINGTLQANPTVTAGQTLDFTDLVIPANSNVMIIYEARANEFAPLGDTAQINNIATLTAPGVSTPATADFTVTASPEPNLSITKALSPSYVAENGQLTYTFVIRNTGSDAADETDNIVLSDTFNPILSDVTVTLDGVALGADEYSYDETTGVFSTTAGRITVPGAVYSQDAATGAWSTTPGSSTLVVTGTV